VNIKKIIAAAFLLSSISAGTAFADPLVDQVLTPSYQIGAPDKGGFCSGEMIKSDRDAKTGKVSTYILTAKHCVKDDEKATYTIRKDDHNASLHQTGVKEYLADVYGTSYKSDLALLKLRDTDTYFDTVATVAKKDVHLSFGQTVEMVGYPLGRSMTWTEGKLGYIEEVQPFADVSNSKLFQRASPESAPGSSGSSLFAWNDTTKKYEIVGILTGGPNQFFYIGLYTPVDEINDYLDTALSTPTPATTVGAH